MTRAELIARLKSDHRETKAQGDRPCCDTCGSFSEWPCPPLLAALMLDFDSHGDSDRLEEWLQRRDANLVVWKREAPVTSDEYARPFLAKAGHTVQAGQRNYETRYAYSTESGATPIAALRAAIDAARGKP